MAKKLTVIETDLLAKPVPNSFFPTDFPTVAGTPGAPKPPNGFSGVKETFVTDPVTRMIADITKLRKKDPHSLVCVSSFVLTHPFLFNAMAHQGSTLAIAQKATPMQPQLKNYMRLFCHISRGDMPGNIFAHLIRRDGQNDFGRMDGFRWLGDAHQTLRWLKNEGRPFAHTKLLLGLGHNDQDKLEPAFGYTGSPNHTGNAEKSFEMVDRTTDKDYLWKLFDVFAYYWSLSEGLYNFSQGLTPTYAWVKKAPKFSDMPKCPTCDTNEKLLPIWVDSDDLDYGPHRVLKCECGHVMPFLKEHQPVVY